MEKVRERMREEHRLGVERVTAKLERERVEFVNKERERSR